MGQQIFGIAQQQTAIFTYQDARHRYMQNREQAAVDVDVDKMVNYISEQIRTTCGDCATIPNDFWISVPQPCFRDTNVYEQVWTQLERAGWCIEHACCDDNGYCKYYVEH